MIEHALALSMATKTIHVVTHPNQTHIDGFSPLLPGVGVGMGLGLLQDECKVKTTKIVVMSKVFFNC